VLAQRETRNRLDDIHLSGLVSRCQLDHGPDQIQILGLAGKRKAVPLCRVSVIGQLLGCFPKHFL
jgi:hypothetical protein